MFTTERTATAGSQKRAPSGQERHGHQETSIGAELHEHARVEHGHRGGSRSVAVRGPGVKRPQRREDPETDEQDGKEHALEHRGKCHRGQPVQVERGQAGSEVQPQDPGENQGAGRHEVERELHGGVFLAPGSPDPDEQVHGKDGHLVEEEEQEQVPRHEDAEDAGGEREQEDEELLLPIRQVPGGEHARRDDHACEEEKQHVDAVHAEVVRDTQYGYPCRALDELQASRGAIVREEDEYRKGQRREGESQGHDADGIAVAGRNAEKDQHRRQGQTPQDGEDGNAHRPAPRPNRPSWNASRTSAAHRPPATTSA